MKDLLGALDLESIPQVSLGTAALLIFGACASLAVLRGLVRILVGSLIVCASGFAAYQAWRFAPGMAWNFAGRDLPWLSIMAPAVAGIGALLVLRALLKMVARPMGESNKEAAEENRRSPVRWAFTLLFSLVPAALLWFGGATALRNIGSVAEIRRFIDGSERTDAPSQFLAELRGSINRALPENWFRGIDPLADEARVTLAKLIALGESSPPKAILVLEEPQIRELILNDPALRKLARERRYADILRDPRLDVVMDDPDLKKILDDLEL